MKILENYFCLTYVICGQKFEKLAFRRMCRNYFERYLNIFLLKVKYNAVTKHVCKETNSYDYQIC